jgi:hypothetical protein
MIQVLTPEEMTALFEGLKEAEASLDSEGCASPKEIISRDRSFPEGPKISKFRDLSNWLMAMADLRWPHL